MLAQASNLSAMDQLQTRGGARIASGRPLPAADQCQDRMASRHAGIASCSPRLVTGRGYGLGALLNSNWLVRRRSVSSHRRAFRGSFLLPENRGARQLIRSAGSRHARVRSAQLPGSRPLSAGNAFGHQHPIDSTVGRLHLSSLSKPSSSAVIQPDSKRGQSLGKFRQIGAA